MDSGNKISFAIESLEDIKEDICEICEALQKDNDDCLPGWWLNKLGKVSVYIEMLSDYTSSMSIDEDDIEEVLETGLTEPEEDEPTEMPMEEDSDDTLATEAYDDPDEWVSLYDPEEDDTLLPPSARGSTYAP